MVTKYNAHDYLFLQDQLTNMMVALAGWTWNDEEMCFVTPYEEIVDSNDYVGIELPNQVLFLEEIGIGAAFGKFIKNVLIFGDGTIEFQTSDDDDAHCFSDFPVACVKNVCHELYMIYLNHNLKKP